MQGDRQAGFGPAAGNGAAETADGDGVAFDVAGLLAKAEAKLDGAGEEDRTLADYVASIMVHFGSRDRALHPRDL